MKGISIVEVIIAAAIIMVSVTGIITALLTFLKISNNNTDKTQAVLMLEETQEVVQYIRDKSYADNIAILDSSDDYYVVWNGLDYSLSTTTQVEKGKFTRKLNFETVDRDVDDDITESGTTDTGTRKVTVDISWSNSEGNDNISSEFLIHDVYQN